MTLRHEYICDLHFIDRVIDEDAKGNRLISLPQFWLEVRPDEKDETPTEVYNPHHGMDGLVNRLFDLSSKNYCIDHASRVVSTISETIEAYDFIIRHDKYGIGNINPELIQTLLNLDDKIRTRRSS